MASYLKKKVDFWSNRCFYSILGNGVFFFFYKM